MNLHVTEPGNAREPRGGPVKFLYPSGSRPLDGYTIKRGVGRGGFGEVYYATSDGGKEVALKLVRRNLDIELRGVIQCLNLKHPNLLSLYDIKQDGEGDTWVVMEYVGGETLDSIIERHPQGMPPSEVLEWFQGIAAGVAYLHDHGIVHRDLKPGNIFCDDGVVKLGDYGLSKFISASRRSGQTESVGTVHYMAPEVANGRYGKEIDLYALGIILYEMLTGHVPFEGESVGEVLMKHLTAQPDLSGLVEPYRSAVARALDKDPARRVHSVQELLDNLPRVASNQPHVFANFAPSGAADASPTAASANNSTPTISQVLAPNGEEPIAKAVREYYAQLKDSWNKADITPGTRFLIIAAGVAALMLSATAWLPVAVVGALCYGGYRVIRSIVLASSAARPASLSRPAAPAAPVAVARAVNNPPPTQIQGEPVVLPKPLDAQAHRRRPRHHRRYRERALTALPLKSTRERATELLGSMLLGAGAATAISVLMLLAFRGHESLEKIPLADLVSLALLSTVGTWAVMVPAKFWEGTIGEPLTRRFILLIVGLSLGAFAWSIDRNLVPTPTYHAAQEVSQTVPIHKVINGGRLHSTFNDSGAPTLNGYLAFFGFLLPVLSWWKMADPARVHRVSLWSAALCIGWAFLLTEFWGFPERGIMIATSMAFAVQLASPWVNIRAARRAAA